MTVTVRLFARVREVAGTESIRLRVSPPTAGGVREALAARYPAAGGLIAGSAVAVNGDYAQTDRPVTQADEIALIPPVSGG
jgi:molybdopterin converting factor subunit 1